MPRGRSVQRRSQNCCSGSSALTRQSGQSRQLAESLVLQQNRREREPSGLWLACSRGCAVVGIVVVVANELLILLLLLGGLLLVLKVLIEVLVVCEAP